MLEAAINLIKMDRHYISYISVYKIHLVFSHCLHFYVINIRQKMFLKCEIVSKRSIAYFTSVFHTLCSLANKK